MGGHEPKLVKANIIGEISLWQLGREDDTGEMQPGEITMQSR